MQFGSGSAAGGVFIVFALNGSPALLLIALVSIILTIVFVVWTIHRRRREIREAYEDRVIQPITR